MMGFGLLGLIFDNLEVPEIRVGRVMVGVEMVKVEHPMHTLRDAPMG